VSHASHRKTCNIARYNIRIPTTRSSPASTNHQLTHRATDFGTAQVARAEREYVDLALAWCAATDPDLGVEIATGFGWAWVVLGDGTAGAARVRNAGTPSTPARARLSSLLLAGWLEASAGNLTLAETDLDAARTIALDLGDAEAVADVQRNLAFLHIQQGRPDDVLSCAAASLSTYRDLGLRWQTATGLVLAAFGALLRGDTTAATRDGAAAIEILTELRALGASCTPRRCSPGSPRPSTGSTTPSGPSGESPTSPAPWVSRARPPCT
jgi:hypothetical protein